MCVEFRSWFRIISPNTGLTTESIKSLPQPNSNAHSTTHRPLTESIVSDTISETINKLRDSTVDAVTTPIRQQSFDTVTETPDLQFPMAMDMTNINVRKSDVAIASMQNNITFIAAGVGLFVFLLIVLIIWWSCYCVKKR